MKFDHEKIVEAIFKTAVDGIILIDARGIIQLANASATRLFGYENDELVGYNVSRLMPADHALQHDHYIARYMQTGEKRIIGIGREIWGLRKDGSMFPCHLSVSEVSMNGQRFFAGMIHDITKRKAVEAEVRLLNAELEARIEERTEKLAQVVNKLLETNNTLQTEIQERRLIEEALRHSQEEVEKALAKERELSELKSRFVSTASHEFRTPLSTILSSVSLIERYTTTETQANREKHIQRIKSAVNNLTGILNDFLSLSKLEEGKFQNTPTEFDLIELSLEIVEEMQVFAKQNQAIQYQHEGDATRVLLDRHFLKNVLINLVSNAIKYSTENTIVHFATSTDAHGIRISVRDEGMGIPQADQEHLFERFFRAHNVTNIQGTGLGLNIVKRYIDLMGGNVRFESQENVGSTFFVEFGSSAIAPE